MDRAGYAAILVVAVVLVTAAIALWSGEQASNNPNTPILYSYTIVNTYPHDSTAFTEGLVISDGVMYESTGEFGESSLRQVNFETGEVPKQIALPSEYFGEGLAAINGSLVQLTWRNNVGLVYDRESLNLIGNFSISTEGWGLTYDGSALVMSDGSSNLTFLDPVSYQKIRQINVHDGDTSITNLNELEYVNGDIYANIWHQQKIAIINPQTGAVKGWIDLTGIHQSINSDDVLNGIAYDPQTGKLYVTGKDWPDLYEITIKPAD